MSTTIDPAKVEELVKAALQGKVMGEVKPEEKAPEPVIVKKTVTKREDQVMFSELFKAVPKSGDFPVTVFKSEHWDTKIRALVPDVDPNYHIQVEEAALLLHAWEDGDKVLMSGPTGSGKSSLVKYCAAVTNRPFIRINMKADIETSQIFGSIGAKDGSTEWVDGAATEAIRHGAVLLNDEWEIMPPEIGMGFQNVLEDNGYLFLNEKPGSAEDKKIIPHKDFRLVYAGNTVGQGDDTGTFAGVQVQNTATLDRFQTTIILSYLDQKHETQVLKNTSPDLPEATIKKMLAFADMVRTANQQGNLMLTMSPRTLINWGRKIVRTGDIRNTLNICFMNKLRDSDKKAVEAMFVRVFGK